MSKTCPNCSLINPKSAQRCDCGYDFGSGMVEPPPTTPPGRKDTGPIDTWKADWRALSTIHYIWIGLLTLGSVLVGLGAFIENLPTTFLIIILVILGVAMLFVGYQRNDKK